MLTNTTCQTDMWVKINCVLNIMRILKGYNPGDLYYEEYLKKVERCGAAFYDIYVAMWELGSTVAPKRILEVGTRTGISLCQLLSSYRDLSVIERIVSIDPYDGYTSPNLVKANLRRLNISSDKIEFIVGKSQDELPNLIAAGAEFDYILIDGDHTKSVAAEDLHMARKLLAPNGVILFDDISDFPGECSLIDVWQEFVAQNPELKHYENMQGKGTALAKLVAVGGAC